VVVGESGMACFDPKNAAAQKLCAAQAAPSKKAEFAGTVSFAPTRQVRDTAYLPWNDYGEHWNGSFFCYYLAGKAMGQAVLPYLQSSATGAAPAARWTLAPAIESKGGAWIWNRDARMEAWSPSGRLLLSREGRKGKSLPMADGWSGLGNGASALLRIVPLD
jgi:hypothetical protein